MAITSNTYTGNGTNKLFSITFPYLDTTDIDVYLYVGSTGVLQTVTTQYSFANATTIEFVIAPPAGVTVLLNRSTDDNNLQATFFPGSSIKASDLNYNFDQVLYLAQETANISNAASANVGSANTNAAAAVVTANNALSTANTAVSTANAASSNANAAVSTANIAASNASTALTASIQATADSTTALGLATTANSNASAAVITANNAETVANGIAATANTALSNSVDALALTNAAVVLADQSTAGKQSFSTLYASLAGTAGSKTINLGADLTSGCVSDYFPGESGLLAKYTCALGCASFNFGTI
jgi:hypothetical protein